jgi:uncharacterized protein with GYD domain
MPFYLLQISYASEAWSAQIKSPQDRLAAVRPVVERMGGKMQNGWLSFGEFDVVAICEMPDNVSAAAFSIAVAASGAIKTSKTTPLLTIEEGIQAMQKASKAGYEPPSA